MKRRSVVLLALLALLAGCRGDGDAGGRWEPVPSGAPADLRPRDGTLATQEFARYADAVDAPWERDPAQLAREFLGIDDGVTSVDGGTVVLLRDDLQDDSIRAERWVLELERDGEQWRLRAARWEQRCHRGRGHQNFSPELCL